MALINAERPSIPSQKMYEYIWVITGRNKIGKTTLASNFPKPYFFKFEPGTSGLMTYETDIIKEANREGIHPWKLFKKAINDFIDNNGYGFQTAIVDPYGVAYDYCQDFICGELGIDHPSDLEWGKGWNSVNDEFEKLTRKLVSNQFTTLIITHMKTKKEKDGIGGEKDVVDLDISGSSGKFIKNITDVFLLADYNEEGERKIFVRPTTNQEAGSRLDFGADTLEFNYDVLENAFHGAIKRVNEKYEITQEMINQHYNHKEKEQEIASKRDEIIGFCQENGITPAENKKILDEEFGYSSVKDLTTLDEIQKHLSILQDE